MCGHLLYEVVHATFADPSALARAAQYSNQLPVAIVPLQEEEEMLRLPEVDVQRLYGVAFRESKQVIDVVQLEVHLCTECFDRLSVAR